MPSLLDDPYGNPGSGPGLLGPAIAPLQIAQPDPDTDQGAALAETYRRVMAEMERQQQISADRGLWDDQTGLPTGKGLVSAANQTAQGILMGTTAPGIRAFHGSPYDFERFDTSKIGTGEGAQAYGHGLYMAENEGVARQYRDVLASRSETNTPEGVAKFWANMQGGHEGGIAHLESVLGQIDKYPNSYAPGEADKINQAIQYLKSGGDLKPAGGHMYEVNIGADPEQFLHWDQTVGQHPPAVRDKLLDMGYGDTDRGADVYSHMARGKEGDAGASQRLLDAGIPGIRYLDQGSRGAGEGTRNTVVFDANTIDILRKYGIAGLGIGLGAAAGTQQPQQ